MPVTEGSSTADPVAPAGGPSRASGREILASIAMAAVGFLVTAGLLHAAIRDPLHLHADVRSEKLVMLNQWHGKVFSAAFGSSHVHNGFVPSVFDAALAGSPAATRSGNLAIEGGSQSEQYVMAREFVSHLEAPAQAGAPPQACLVILELGAGATFTLDHLVHPRAINIYDWPTTRLMTHFAAPDMSTYQRSGRDGFALAAMGLHYANVGMLSSEIFTPPLSATTLESQTEDDRRGQMVMPYRPAYLPRLYDLVAHMPKHPAIRPEKMIAGNADLIAALAASSAVRNLAFVYINMPRLEDLGTAFDLPDHLTVAGPSGPIEVPVINLGRPDRFPELYNPRIWYDDSHFDGQGARLATRIFAEQLKQWYAAHGGPQPCR